MKVRYDVSCIIDNDLAAQLESYRAMKIANIAPAIEFPHDYYARGYQGGKPVRIDQFEAISVS